MNFGGLPFWHVVVGMAVRAATSNDQYEMESFVFTLNAANFRLTPPLLKRADLLKADILDGFNSKSNPPAPRVRRVCRGVAPRHVTPPRSAVRGA